MVTLTGKFSGSVLTAVGDEGTDPGWEKVTFMTWPSLFAGPHPPPEVQVMWRSAK
jgi:hypothetical protein